jgi:hypothetical protein
MADYLGVVASYVDPRLVESAAFERICLLAQCLPPLSLAGLECRLAAGETRVDLLANLTRARVRFNEDLLCDPAWRFLDRLVEDWLDPRTMLQHHLKGVFMEFDLVGPSPVPAPSLFFALQEGPASADVVLAHLARQLPQVSGLGTSLDCPLFDLPAGAALANLGVMLGRSPPRARARLVGLEPAEIASVLGFRRTAASGGWQAALAVAEIADGVAVLADIVEREAPAAGLELFFDHQHPKENRWTEVLARLVDRGACDPQKMEAVLRWPGAVTLPRARSPQVVAWGDLLLSGRAASVFWRRVNHIKVTPESDGRLSAKVYLAFGHSWIDRCAAKRAAGGPSRDLT